MKEHPGLEETQLFQNPPEKSGFTNNLPHPNKAEGQMTDPTETMERLE